MNSTRTVPVQVGAGGHVSLAHPLAKAGEPSAGRYGYIVAIDAVPGAVVPGAVLLAFSAVSVCWPVGTPPAERRIPWDSLASMAPGAVVRMRRADRCVTRSTLLC